MRFQILNVGHGFCAYAVADNGNLMLFDCGHNGKDSVVFRPSSYLYHSGFRSIELLFITNYDQDHISDLPQLCHYFDILTLYRNKSIQPIQLRGIKEQSGAISNAMEKLLDMMSMYVAPVASPPEFPNIEYQCFHNYYPDFQDTNNLSLVTFLSLGNFMFLIPGDMEEPGWKKLLANREFCSFLKQVDVFIASHHGRESGYCEEVFDYCHPRVVVMSDGPIVHATQEMVRTYASHAHGDQYRGERRYVLTTRTDGSVCWDF